MRRAMCAETKRLDKLRLLHDELHKAWTQLEYSSAERDPAFAVLKDDDVTLARASYFFLSEI